MFTNYGDICILLDVEYSLTSQANSSSLNYANPSFPLLSCIHINWIESLQKQDAESISIACNAKISGIEKTFPEKNTNLVIDFFRHTRCVVREAYLYLKYFKKDQRGRV